MITSSQLLPLLGISSKSTLSRLIRAGKFPRPDAPSQGRAEARWHESTIERELAFLNQRWIARQEVLDLTGRSSSALYDWIKGGLFPEAIARRQGDRVVPIFASKRHRFGGESSLWSEGQIQDWLTSPKWGDIPGLNKRAIAREFGELGGKAIEESVERGNHDERRDDSGAGAADRSNGEATCDC